MPATKRPRTLSPTGASRRTGRSGKGGPAKAASATAAWRWIDDHGEGRNVHAYFRRDFTLPGHTAGKATLHLFACARYVLYVNGVSIGAGPVRFRLEEPCFDSWDLTPHLRRGKNTLAVHVQAYGRPAQIQNHCCGAFNAWGELSSGGTSKSSRGVDLHGSTWICRRADGYDADAEVFSFTSPAVDILDSRRDQVDWMEVAADLSGWKPTTALARQDLFGKPVPRPIPHLTQDARTATRLIGAYRLLDDEDLISFRLSSGLSPSAGCWGVAQTWIHSPVSQAVPVGLWWGEHYLNGVEIVRNPSREGLINRNDATLPLDAGWNSFFVKFGLVASNWDFQMAFPRAAGLTFQAETPVEGKIGKKTSQGASILTAGPLLGDELTSWKAMTLPPDPRALPEVVGGWTQRELVAVDTSPATALAWCRLGEPIELDPLVVAPVLCDSPSTFFYDLGAETLGRITLSFEAAAGTVIDIGFSEHLQNTLPPGNRPAILERFMIFAGERVISAGGPQRFETMAPRGLRYVQLKVVPAPKAPKPVSIHAVGVIQQIYPFTQVGSFACSNPVLEQVWAMGWRTLRMCSEDVYTDCPWRERLLYAGDFLVEMATTLAGSGDLRLIARCLELLSPPVDQPQATCNDFGMIPMVILAWYQDRGGDPRVVKRLFPRYAATLDARLAQVRPDGLYDSSSFIDWIASERDSCLAAFNAVVIGACVAMARIANRLGQPRPDWLKRARALKTLVRARFWDETAGAYRDGFTGETPLPGHHLAASAWSSLFAQATTPAQDARLRSHYERLLPDVHAGAPASSTSSYGGFHILGALYRAGHVDLAERFMIQAYGSFVEAGWDTCGELFPARERLPDGSWRYRPHNGWTMCHAWSSAPTFYLSSQVLGVDLGFPEVADPDQLVISPCSSELTWARGVVPLPRGPVSVEWRREGETLLVTCSVPKGVQWSVRPRGALAGLTLWVNGERAATS